jgi:hypothetical protein
MPRLKTLMQMTGERPRCQFCDKPLKPATRSMWLKGHVDVPPDLERLTEDDMALGGKLEDARRTGYRPELVYKLKHLDTDPKYAKTEVSYWAQACDGWGQGKDGTRLFCSFQCGVYFAEACWNSDMRINRDK